jgi:uncharacterized membrane protein
MTKPRPSQAGPRRLGTRRLVRQTVTEIVRLEQRDRLAISRSERIADWITALSGSMPFVYFHVVWFAVWIALNQGFVGPAPFDPFPFGLLTMLVSLEAIFLATFVLISQNRQALQSDRRTKIDLQLNVISEQEVTTILRVLDLISAHLGVDLTADPDLHGMEQVTDLTRLMDEIDEAELSHGSAGERQHGHADDAARAPAPGSDDRKP